MISGKNLSYTERLFYSRNRLAMMLAELKWLRAQVAFLEERLAYQQAEKRGWLR